MIVTVISLSASQWQGPYMLDLTELQPQAYEVASTINPFKFFFNFFAVLGKHSEMKQPSQGHRARGAELGLGSQTCSRACTPSPFSLPHLHEPRAAQY